MMEWSLKKIVSSLRIHPPLIAPYPSPTTYNNVCHKLYKGLLKPFFVKASIYHVMMPCYVMLLVIYTILYYTIYKVILYKTYDITSVMLCYALGCFSLLKKHQKTQQFNAINRQKGGQLKTC